MKIVKSSCSSKRKVRTCTFSPQVNIKNKRTAIQTEQDVNAAHSEAKIQDLIDDIRSNIYTKVKAVATSPDFGFDENEVDDYFFVEASATEIGEDHHEAIRVEVRAEVSYEGLEDLMEALNPIIETYDSYAYFEPVEPGIIEAYVSVDQVDMSVYGSEDEVVASGNSEYTNRYVTKYKNKSYTIYDNSNSVNLPQDADIEALQKWKAQVTQQAGAYNDADRDYQWAKLENGVIYYYRNGKLEDKSYYMSPSDWNIEQLSKWSEAVIDEAIENLYEANKNVPDRMIHNSTSIEATDSYNLDDETYEYVTNVDGYWVYRAVVDGKGVWRAMPQGSNESQFDSLSFPISYDQARGFEPIDEPSAITKLRKDLGKKLFPKAGQSVEATEDLSMYPEGFESAYTLAKNDFMNDYQNAHVNVQIAYGDPYAEDNEIHLYVSGYCDFYGKTCDRYVIVDSNSDADTIYEALEEAARDIGISKCQHDIENSVDEITSSTEYLDINGILGEPNVRYSSEDLRSIYEEGKDHDPSISQYDSYESWFKDTEQYLDKIYSDKEDIASSTDDKVFIEDIIDGLEDNGYDLNDLSSIKEGLWALFGYQGEDANDVIEDLVAGGFIDSNVLIDSGRKSVYSDTEYDDEYDEEYDEYDEYDEEYDEYDEERAEDNPWVQQIAYTMSSEMPPWFTVQGDNLEYDVTYNGQTVHVEFFLFEGAKYTYYIDGDGPYTTNQSEEIEQDIEDYIDEQQEGITSATEEDEEGLPMVDQEYDSAATSINSNKLPAIYKMVSFNEGDVVVDFGGGKFDNAVEYIRDKGATLCVYDPYNRSAEHNKEVLRILRENGGADAAVNSNVLNVIKEPEARKNVLENIARITKPGAPIYITVYEGKGDGQEGPTKSGYQLNRKTADYLEEIQEVFPDATRKGKLITAHNSGSVSSATDIQTATNPSYEKYLLNQVGSLLIDKLESEYDIEFFLTDMYIDGDDMHIQVYGDDSLHGDVDIPVDYSGDVYDFADDAFNKLKDIFQNNSSNTVEGSQDISRYDKEIVSYRKIISKSVEDNDDFLTDYTMYEVVTEDGSVEYECYFGDNDLYGPWNGEGLDFEADNYDEAVKWYNSYSSDEIQSSESVEGSISPEEFFTKYDLIEFAISVEDEINRRINPKKKFNVSDAYVEGNTVHIEVHNDAYELSGEAAIDMRRIKRPSDIHKYLPPVVDAMINEYNEVRTDEITSSTVLDSNTEFRKNFEEAVDIFYEEYPATVELTDEQDEEYDTLYKAHVRETGVLYSVKPGVVYIDINWDSSDILQALEETAEAIGIEHYPDPLDVDASESIQGDAFSSLENQYLSPPEYDDPIEHEDSQELIEVELDQVITVDVDGDYEWDDDTYVWASPDGSNEEWRSEDGVYIDDKVGVVEHIDDLIIPNVPTRPGKYRVTGLAKLIYDVSGIQEYRTNYGPDDYESDIDTDHAAVSFNFSKSSVENLKITPVRR